MTDFWQKILSELLLNRQVSLLYVVDSNGSSPGRQGFKMAVLESGELIGSIGGGIMEHKLVELAKAKLSHYDDSILLKKQIHSNHVNENKSGMICSGEQTICILLIDSRHKDTIQNIISNIESKRGETLSLTLNGLELIDKIKTNSKYSFTQNNLVWKYIEDLNFKNTIHIIGSGHVGLALSRQMNWLGFHVIIYDDREKLNTFESNKWADEKVIIDYDNIKGQIPSGNDYVVLVSFGYKTDKKILEQLIGRKYHYLGMMGSKAKTKVLIEALLKDGFTESQLSKLHAPIGIKIDSKTPEEIAVSIAAEIIEIKNCGRSPLRLPL